jgi:hypothetical protein
MPSWPGLRFVVHVEELEHVQDDVGQMLNGAVVEIVARGGRGQAGGGGAGECADGGRSRPVHLLVGESHPHRRLVLDEIGVRQMMLPPDRFRHARQDARVTRLPVRPPGSRSK